MNLDPWKIVHKRIRYLQKLKGRFKLEFQELWFPKVHGIAHPAQKRKRWSQFWTQRATIYFPASSHIIIINDACQIRDWLRVFVGEPLFLSLLPSTYRTLQAVITNKKTFWSISGFNGFEGCRMSTTMNPRMFEGQITIMKAKKGVFVIHVLVHLGPTLRK